MATIGELFIELAFEGDTSKAEEFKKKLLEVSKAGKKQETSFKQIKGAILGYVTAVTGAVYAVQRLTDSLIKSNQQFLNLTRTSDMALSTYQKWNGVGKMFGIDNAADQIKNLNDRIFELKLTGANAQGFMLAGINPTNAQDVMEQLRRRVSGLSDTSASYLLQQLGIDPSMLHILRMTKGEFEALNNEIKKFQLTKEQRDSIQQMNIQIQIASQKLQYFKDRVILAILPAWTKFLESLVRVTQGLGKAIKAVINYTKTLDPLIKLLLGVAAAIGVVRLALIALTAHPIVAAISALLGVLYLLIDDVVGYTQGKNSGIGYLINFFKDLGEYIDFNTPQWIKDLLEIIRNSAFIKSLKDNRQKNEEKREERQKAIEERIAKPLKQKIEEAHPILTDKAYQFGTWVGEKMGERRLRQYNNNINNNRQTSVVINADIQTNESMKTLEDLYTPYLSNTSRTVAYQTA